MRIGVIGINHKLAELKVRELFAWAAHSRFRPGHSLHPGLAMVLLTTCNRTEIYFSSEDPSESHIYLLDILRREIKDDFEQRLYSFFGKDCLLHLARVTSGLDSAIVAETEIQGQVKAAYEQTMGSATLPLDMHYLFQKALQTGKKVRSQIPLSRGLPNLEDAIWHMGNHPHPKVLVIGASTINQRVIEGLKRKNCALTLTNRSGPILEEWGQKYNLKNLPWQDLQGQWPSFDWVISGIKSPHYILRDQPLQTPVTLFDLSVPRTIDPALGQRTSLINIDHLNQHLQTRSEKLQLLLNQAETLVTEMTHRHTSLFSKRRSSPQEPIYERAYL